MFLPNRDFCLKIASGATQKPEEILLSSVVLPDFVLLGLTAWLAVCLSGCRCFRAKFWGIQRVKQLADEPQRGYWAVHPGAALK